MREDVIMKDTNRRKLLGRLATAAALGWLVKWAVVAQDAQAGGRKAKTKKKTKTKVNAGG